MTPERAHSQATIAIEERDWIGDSTLSIQEFEPPFDAKSTPEECLAAISMSASLLALNGALVPKRKRQATSEQTAHASLCLGKRIFDVLFSLCALITFLPILSACALAMKVESRGPLFFRQRRLGTDGAPFQILKFRTMVPNAESVLAAYLALDPQAKAEWDADRKIRKDPRITHVGAIMRKFSLDELPQFWNVLKGDMSIVGPRPIVQAEVHYYADDFRQYSAVRPGITGLWQVSGRNDVSYPNRVALDCQYVRSWSGWLDLRIIVQTVSTVLGAAGAY